MDLMRYWEVLRRHRTLVGVGLGVAVILAFLSAFSVSTDGVSSRQKTEHGSQVTLFVTAPGFPWGRTSVVTEDGTVVAGDSSGVADTSRLPDMATIYANLANGDDVRALASPFAGDYIADVGRTSSSSNASTLPLVNILATAPSGEQAQETAAKVGAALKDYVATQQERAKIPERERTVIQLLNEPSEPFVTTGRSYTRTIVLFLTVVIVFVGLAFMRENLTQQRRRTAGETTSPSTAGVETAGPAAPAPSSDAPAAPTTAAATGDDERHPRRRTSRDREPAPRIRTGDESPTGR